ncbi:DUF5329 domain-containing protein [Simiduia agarivorans]|uniref:Uncharacterized protein n=1 Tax=Simiduia agarivorans (strain DSM 21679 / JCM 13881 / BCRC 17597 / SA1) TaxID=1117647 RepID=K4KLB3_SIMAS|nr:DUF5329 domain-containing protein [Simiduia agarivorans]AFU98848.1 hypothetical protein M5M_08295 [Simiduia agarivorans SA1 = DSM 21679]
MPFFRLALFGLLAIVWMPTALAADLPASEQQRVAFLIESVARLQGAVFIRNGTEHPAADAAEHLTMKLRRAKNSWFAPPAESWTAELFIDKLASRSSISGKPYQIRFADGSLVNAGDWLRQQLARYDAGASSD